MIDTAVEMRSVIPPRMLHIMRMGEMIHRTTAVNSIQGIASETYPWDKAIDGLSTMGLNTCTAIAGYYLKEAKLELFLAHVQPMARLEELLSRLKLDTVEGITLGYINGTLTQPDKNAKLRQAVENFFGERHINVHSIPEGQINIMKAPANEKVHSYGALLRMQKTGSSTELPQLTVFDEI